MDEVDSTSFGANQEAAKPALAAAGVSMATSTTGKLLLTSAETDYRSSSSSYCSMPPLIVLIVLIDNLII